MNEEINAKLLQYLEKTETTLESIVDFSSDQVPEIIEQLIMFNLVMSGAYVSLGILLLLAIFPVCKIANSFDDKDLCSMFKSVGSGCLGTISMIMICSEMSTLIKCWIAPKLFVLEYIANLIK
jgi:hypothetical protein